MAESLNSTDRLPVFTITGHNSNVWKSSFTSDARYICTCSSDESVKLWTLPSDQHKSEVARLTDHVGVVRGCDFAPDSTLLSTCSWDKRILLYRTSDLKVSFYVTCYCRCTFNEWYEQNFFLLVLNVQVIN